MATQTASDWLDGSTVEPAEVPAVLQPLLRAVPAARHAYFSRNDPAALTVADRQAAVLILIGTDGPHGPDVLLQQRASGLSAHAGEVSYPGGSREAADAGPVETALREAVEETGLDAAGVDPLALLPRLHIPPSRFDVTAVLAHWRVPSPVHAVDTAETARVMRVPIAELADPAHRLSVRTASGWIGPAFLIPGAVVWGFTGEILTALLRLASWERPWDTDPAGAVDLAHAWELAADHSERNHE